MSSDDEARIARWEHLTFSSEERKVQEGVALMRSLLARAVKAEADLAKQTHRENEGVMIFDGIVADLRAKLAAAEKARDAALAAQNAKAMEELECLGDRGARWEWMPAGYQREIQLRLAALRSAPPAAPAGEAPAGDDDTLRRFLRRDDAHRGGELLLSVVADLCRRELARGER